MIKIIFKYTLTRIYFIMGSINLIVVFIKNLISDEKFSLLKIFLENYFNILSNFWIIVLLLPIIFILFYNKNYKIVYFYIKTLKPSRLTKAIRNIHLFEHTYDKQMLLYKALINKNKHINSEESRIIVEELLNYISGAMSDLYNNKVSVHIKLFQTDNYITPIEVSSNEKLKIKVYERSPSENEDNLIEKGTLQERNDEEKYIITLYPEGNSQNIQKLKAKGVMDDSPLQRYNSAYNYVFSDEKHYWISTNLKNEDYESSSNNWERYYKSLAVFLLAPPQNNQRNKPKYPIGLLILDSPDEGTFANRWLARHLLAFYSHRVFDFLSLIYRYTKIIDKREQEKENI